MRHSIKPTEAPPGSAPSMTIVKAVLRSQAWPESTTLLPSDMFLVGKRLEILRGKKDPEKEALGLAALASSPWNSALPVQPAVPLLGRRGLVRMPIL